ncbi:MAG TPA: diacylglycerol kinase [Mycobacterium sp.]|nr:diacylglycerol kinase [Mycobacterium sp.]
MTTQHNIARVTLLTNPRAGHGNAPHAAQRAVARLQQRGVDVTEIVGRDTAHARQLVAAALAAGTDALVVAGGDGVISLALQELAHSAVPLGIIPGGTGNDHAREYGIPTDDPEAAADIVADGWAETVDLGRIDGDGVLSWFGTVMATGFDSLVSDRTNRMRWPRGRMRYNLAILAELSRLRPLTFTLAFDGGEPVHLQLTLAAFGNTRSYGGGMQICPTADHADGLLEVTMVRSGSRTKLLRLFPTVYKGTHIHLDEVSTARAKSVRVDCPGINVYADGEFVCPLPVTVSAQAGALQILRQP